MRILVTGGAGFIGSAVVRHLVAEGAEVLNVDKLTYAGNLQSLRAIENAPNYRFLQADICDRGAMRAALSDFGPDRIYHLAAESHVDRSITGAGAFVETNVIGTFTLLEAAREHYSGLAGPAKDAFRFVHVSTDEVYGSLGADGLFTEETSYDPSSPYSASKAASDHMAIAWHRTYGLPVVISNCSNNYGPFHFPEKLIPLIILNALHGKPLPVYGDGSNIRDWLYVEDHARAIHIVGSRGRPGRNTTSAAATSAATSTSSAASAPFSTASGPPAAARAADHLRDRPPRPRSPLRHRRHQARDRTRLEGRGDFRHRDRQDRALVSRQRVVVAPAPRQGLRRRTARGARAGAGGLI